MEERAPTRMLQLALLGEACQHLSGGAVFVWDEDRRYVAVNDEACRLVGVSRDELLGMELGTLTPDRATPHFQEAQRREHLGGRLSFSRRDGSVVEIDWVTFHTRVAGLPYMLSVCWPAGDEAL